MRLFTIKNNVPIHTSLFDYRRQIVFLLEKLSASNKGFLESIFSNSLANERTVSNFSEEYMIVSELPLPFNVVAWRPFENFPSVTTDKSTRGLVTYEPAISTSIPEPSAIIGFAVLGLGGWLLKKKATAPIA